MLDEILRLLGGGALILAGAWWIARTLVERSLKRELEDHKAQLQQNLEDHKAQLQQNLAAYEAQLRHAQELAVEQLRHDLEQRALEHEVRYRRIDAIAAEHIAGVYGRIVESYQAFGRYEKARSVWCQPSVLLLDAAVKANEDLQDYLLRSQIHLPPELYSKTDAFTKKVVGIVDTVKECVAYSDINDDYGDESFDRMEDAFGDWAKDINPLLAELADAYRRQLGIKDGPA